MYILVVISLSFITENWHEDVNISWGKILLCLCSLISINIICLGKSQAAQAHDTRERGIHSLMITASSVVPT